MTDIVCDECGTTPYLGISTSDEYDAELWCDCPSSIPVVLVSNFGKNGKPDSWGESGTDFKCYQCGATPEMGTVVTSGLHHPKVKYTATCRCDVVSGFSLRVKPRGVMPDKWKDNFDPTKWPDVNDELIDEIEENGPSSIGELSEEFGVDKDGIKTLLLHLQREEEVERRSGGKYDIPDLDGISAETVDENDGDDQGFFGRLFSW